METGPGRSRIQTTAQLLSLLLTLGFVLWMIWELTPSHRKTAMSLTLLRSYRRALSLHARHIAGLSMARELASGGQVQDYGHSYRLALAVDRVDARINLIKSGLA